MNGRERIEEQVSACISAKDLMVIIGGGSRLEILRTLLEREYKVTELADALELAVPMVSSNLRVLRENGLVNVRRYKKYKIYSIRRERVQGIANGQFVRLRVRSDTGEWLVTKVRKPVQLDGSGRASLSGKCRCAYCSTPTGN